MRRASYPHCESPQLDAERGAFAGHAFDRDAAVVVADDRLHNRQALALRHQFVGHAIEGARQLPDLAATRAPRELFQPGADPSGLAGGSVSARKTPDLSGGRSSMTVFHTVSTSTLSY